MTTAFLLFFLGFIVGFNLCLSLILHFLSLVIENLPQSTTVSKVKDVSEGKDVEKKVKTVSFNPSVQVHDCETARSQTDVDIGSVAANGRLIEKKVDNTAVDLSKRKRWAKDEWKKTMEKLRERKNEKENIEPRQQPQKAVQPSKVAFGRTTRLRPPFAASVGKRVHKIPALRVTVNVPEKHFRRTVYEPLAMMRIGENMEGLDSRKKQWSIRDFELRELLGEGKFGRVYLANKLNSKIPVALKVIEKKQIEESGFRHLVMREILIQSNLKHPNVLRLYNWFEDEQQICLVLENADGGELYKELKRSGHFSEREAATYIASVTNGLAHCHSRDVIHRDIKLENLLLKSDGQVKISDFGLSVMSKDKRWSVVGTLDYLAPEVLECKAHDCAVDNWAVGVLCYEFLYGAPPFETESLYDTKRRIMDVDFSFPSTPTVSADAKNLISQLLVKDSSKRLTLRQVQKHPWIINNALF